MLTALESSLAIAEAMEARGYGRGPRTHFHAQRSGGADVIVAMSALAALIVFTTLRLTGVASDWYPFPTLTVPSANALMVVCCVVLAMPAVLRKP